MIVHYIIVQAAVQPFNTSCTKNKNNIDLFSRLIAMNGQGGSGKSYTIDTILTTLVNDHGSDEDCHLELATSGLLYWRVYRT